MPGVLQSMGSQRVRHDRATKQQKMTALENSSENLQWRRITSCSRCKCKPPSVALRALWDPGRPLFSHLSSSAHPGARTVPCARHTVSSPRPRSAPFSRKYPSHLSCASRRTPKSHVNGTCLSLSRSQPMAPRVE